MTDEGGLPGHASTPGPGGPPPTGPRGASFPRFDDRLLDAVRERRPRRVVLQVPAGLVRDAHRWTERIRAAAGCETVILARPCFGACDVPTPDEVPGVDLAVVLGHAPIPNMPLPLPTLFVEMREAGGDPEALAESVVRAGLPAKLGLVASIQHLDLVPPFVTALARRGVVARTAAGDRRLAYPGQALGCNYTSAESLDAEVDGFLFLGTGRFHPLGLAYVVTKPVWALDPLQNLLEPPIDRVALIARRQLRVAAARDARRWGILVSSFPGQNRGGTALALQRRAEAHGREAEILLFGRLDPRDLEGRDIDAYVNTACPRIALDDAELYPKPMLTPPEFLMALGERPLDRYVFDTYH